MRIGLFARVSGFGFVLWVLFDLFLFELIVGFEEFLVCLSGEWFVDERIMLGTCILISC